MNRHEFFQKRLREMGLFDKDSDYEGMIGRTIEKMSSAFSEEGQSGASAEIVNAVWNQLMDEWKAS